MLNAELKIEKKEAMDYKPLPENIYQVELLDITSETKPTYDTRTKPEDEQEFETVLKFQYTLLAGKDGETSLRGRNVWHGFVPTYLYIGKNGKNNLYRIVEALLGRQLTPQEEAEGLTGKHLNSLIGKQCRVGLKHKKSGEKVYENIETYYPVEQLMPALTPEEKEKATVKKDEEKTEQPKDDYADIPEKEVQYPEDSINPDDVPF